MKRDMDLIREILLKIEDLPVGSAPGQTISVEGYSPKEVWYNARLAQEAGLINAAFLPNSEDFFVKDLTWKGHEFLDASRNKSLWERAKQKALEATGGLSIEVLTAVLTKLAVHASIGPK